MKPNICILRYPGAKYKIADWIISYIPEHKVYVEPYAGSLAVLLNKERSHIETINDINGDVVNLFKVIRNYPNELEELLYWTPYAREEYNGSFEETNNPIEKARRFCIQCWMGFGASNAYKNGFKSGQQDKSPNPSKGWAELPAMVKITAERLRGVQIENLPALDVLKRYNTPDVFLYLDPPYYPDKRKGYLYKYEMDKMDHEEMLKQICKHPGKILLSGYDNDLYNYYLKGWNKESKEVQAEGGTKRREFLWMNYEYNKQLTINDYMNKAS